jgi:two-component system, cell cycle sensor histidine kinase and response regulator CckA
MGRLPYACWLAALGIGLSALLYRIEGGVPMVGIMHMTVLVVAYMCGRNPALVLTAAATVLGVFVVPHELVRMALFAVNGTFVSILVGRLIQTTHAHQQSEDRFRLLFDASPLPTLIVREPDNVVVDVNAAFLKAFAWTRTEMIGMQARAINLYTDATQRKRLLEIWSSQGTVRNFEMMGRRKTGEARTLLVSVDRVMVGNVPHAQTVINDITNDIIERKRADAALRESESRFRALADNIEDVFWVTQTDGECVYASPAFERVWGRRCTDLYKHPQLWLDAVHPEDRDRIRAAIPSQGAVRPDFSHEYRIYRPDGTLRWIRDRGSAVRDEAGRIIRFVGIAEDITEQRTLEDQLRQTQKMESLGLLAGGVAHDFNNLLAVISASSGMLADEIPKSSSQRELVDEIANAVDRATGLTRQLLAFSRRQVTEPRVMDLNQVVNETRKMLRRMLGEDIILSVSLEPELGHVRADPGYLVQVLMNLAVNARDAMPRGGSLSLSTRNVNLTADATRGHPGAKVGPAVELTVRDTGSGIPAEIQHRIFEPFFTTKGVGRGTGMGLAVVHGIVDQAGGFIELDSQPNIGTTFRIYLPTVNESIAELDEIAGAMALGVESVLFVDDDDYVRRVAARALRTRGYTVIEASDGNAALAALTRERIDLLLTDVVMPGMDGRQLAELACTKQPELKVLYTSGYTDDAVVRH